MVFHSINFPNGSSLSSKKKRQTPQHTRFKSTFLVSYCYVRLLPSQTNHQSTNMHCPLFDFPSEYLLSFRNDLVAISNKVLCTFQRPERYWCFHKFFPLWLFHPEMKASFLMFEWPFFLTLVRHYFHIVLPHVLRYSSPNFLSSNRSCIMW